MLFSYLRSKFQKKPYKVVDIGVRKTSDLLEEAHKAYPNVKYRWDRGTQQDFKEKRSCPAALLYGAAGISYSDNESIGTPKALADAIGAPTSRPLGHSLSDFSKYRNSFPQVINDLRAINC